MEGIIKNLIEDAGITEGGGERGGPSLTPSPTFLLSDFFITKKNRKKTKTNIFFFDHKRPNKRRWGRGWGV